MPEKQENQARPQKFSEALQTKGYQRLIRGALQDPQRANRFIAAILSAVAVNPELQECDAGTILAGALLGESLGLSPSPQLGQYFLVPFEDAKNKRKTAAFQIGYKGYIQLAVRSGQYEKLNVLAIKKGELARFDPLNEEIEVRLIEDEIAREAAETAGYYAMFKLTGGFTKRLYWSREKMEAHAARYSKAYQTDKKKGWTYSYWSKDFDGMAHKTMLRQLISKWGGMSAELITAYEKDMGLIGQDGGYLDDDGLPPLPAPPQTPAEPEGAAARAKKTVTMKDLADTP
jgi:recombination protein RecT